MAGQFNIATEKTLTEKCLPVLAQRGDEYQDSWHPDNLKTPFFDQVYATLFPVSDTLSAEQKRLIVIASLCDVKISRMVGAFKSDTYEDLINYVAALRTWLAEYVGSEKPVRSGMLPHG